MWLGAAMFVLKRYIPVNSKLFFYSRIVDTEETVRVFRLKVWSHAILSSKGKA